MTPVRALPLLALIVALTPCAARAQTDDADLQRAVVLFEEAEGFYNRGEFAEAASMIRRAYELSPNPTLLFNLARALEGMGDLDGAIETYQRYLDEAGDVQDRGAIERRLQTLRDQRERLSADGPDGDPVDQAVAEGSTGVGDVTTDEGGGASIDPVPWIVAGVGVAVLGAGVAFGVVSQDYDTQAADEPVMATAVDLHSQAETFAILANVFFIAGGLTAAAGLVWGIVSLTGGGDEETEVSARVLPGGLELFGRF